MSEALSYPEGDFRHQVSDPICRSLDLVKDIDCVVPVPDGSRPAAIQISAHLGLPYREGLVKNRYVGRTFIMPDQQ